jgi:predicted Rossmann fold flavoprotein
MANFIPDFDENSLQAHLVQIHEESPRKTLKHVLIELIPQRLAEIILLKAGLKPALPINQLNKVSRGQLIGKCVYYPLEVTGALGYIKAEVTAGGVDLSEINPKKLESKLMPGLYFAGEILDVDGRIGGFNFQWAWASGHAAAQAIIKDRSTHEQKNH